MTVGLRAGNGAAQPNPTQPNPGKHKGAIPSISKRDIAKLIGASREMVSRVMKDLQLGGYIEVRGRSIALRSNILLAE